MTSQCSQKRKSGDDNGPISKCLRNGITIISNCVYRDLFMMSTEFFNKIEYRILLLRHMKKLLSQSKNRSGVS